VVHKQKPHQNFYN